MFYDRYGVIADADLIVVSLKKAVAQERAQKRQRRPVQSRISDVPYYDLSGRGVSMLNTVDSPRLVNRLGQTEARITRTALLSHERILARTARIIKPKFSRE